MRHVPFQDSQHRGTPHGLGQHGRQQEHGVSRPWASGRQSSSPRCEAGGAAGVGGEPRPTGKRS
eukprot:3761690-Prymnesium_polylepis.1